MSTTIHRQQLPDDLRARRLALVVIDVQNDYCHPDGVFARAGLRVDDLGALVARINRLVAAARERGEPVIWAKMLWDGAGDGGLLPRRSPFLAEEGLRRGTWGAQLVDGLDVSPTDPIVEKRRFSAFFETDLERIVRDAGATALVVAGVRTDFCVESTVRDAMFRDLEVVVPREAVAGYVADLHEHSLRLMGTVFAWVSPVDDVLALLTRPDEGQED